MSRPYSRARKVAGSSLPPPVSDVITEGRIVAPLQRGLRLQLHATNELAPAAACSCRCRPLGAYGCLPRGFRLHACACGYLLSHPTAVLPNIPLCNCSKSVPNRPLWGRSGRFGTLLQQWECGILGRTAVQPFSQKSRTPTVPNEFQIGLYDPAGVDLEHFCNCCSAGFLGERL